MVKNSIKYTVIARTSYYTQFPIITFDTEREAYNYCDKEGWVFMDENEFAWTLDVIEEEVVEVICS
jgi:hypothetical protein